MRADKLPTGTLVSAGAYESGFELAGVLQDRLGA
jgi:hypothetical protein